MEKEIMLETVLQYLSEKRFASLRALLSDQQSADLAELFDEIDREKLIVLYRILPKELASEVFVEMSPEQAKLLIDSFSDFELRETLNELYTDDTVDLIEEMPANVVSRILKVAAPAMRREINELLKYPDDSVGSIMATEYVALKKTMTVAESLDHIRAVAIDKETIYTAYVVDSTRRLVGLVTAKDLLLSKTDAVIGDIMEENVIFAETGDDRESVARMFDKYHLIALPVTDREGRLVGIVTVDDVLEVLHEETEEDFAKMAAITPTDKTYLKTSVIETFLTRIPWLLLLMISATFTGLIISSFESALAASVILTSFIPMLMDTGGNSGSQASVTVIRGLSLGEIAFRDAFRVLFKEARVGVLCGAVLSAASFLKLLLFDRVLLGNEEITLTVAAVVCLTLMITVLSAKVIGCILPILAKRIGFDPAVMASPFITTLVDAISLLVYFSVAKSLLPI